MSNVSGVWGMVVVFNRQGSMNASLLNNSDAVFRNQMVRRHAPFHTGTEIKRIRVIGGLWERIHRTLINRQHEGIVGANTTFIGKTIRITHRKQSASTYRVPA